MSHIEVVRTMLPILVQDLGRPGYADLGVTASGAYDRASARLAARLVGNGEQCAVLEITLGGAVLTTAATVTAVVTGAPAPLRAHGVDVAVNEVFSWTAGSVLSIGSVQEGARCYLAVRGGFAVPRTLGSCATDVLSGLGPAPLAAGSRIGLALGEAGLPVVSHAPVALPPRGTVRVRLGPRADWFAPAAVERLLGGAFVVSPDSNRIGLRLIGPQLSTKSRRELPSEPLQRGAVQVPPSGEPIIMGPDHPTTGGYPVLATVPSRDWDLMGQMRPGDRLRFELDSR